jgi:hypothetical protein
MHRCRCGAPVNGMMRTMDSATHGRPPGRSRRRPGWAFPPGPHRHLYTRPMPRGTHIDTGQNSNAREGSDVGNPREAIRKTTTINDTRSLGPLSASSPSSAREHRSRAPERPVTMTETRLERLLWSAPRLRALGEWRGRGVSHDGCVRGSRPVSARRNGRCARLCPNVSVPTSEARLPLRGGEASR